MNSKVESRTRWQNESSQEGIPHPTDKLIQWKSVGNDVATLGARKK